MTNNLNDEQRMRAHLVFTLSEYSKDKVNPWGATYQYLEEIKAIRNIALKHLRLCEDYCNLQEPSEGYYDNKLTAIEEKADKLMREGWSIEHQRDPRGATMTLKIGSASYPLAYLKI